MPLAERLSGPIESRDLDTDPPRWEILRDVVVGLGVRRDVLERWARMAKPAHVKIRAETGRTIIDVKAPFDTDFASVPVLAQLFMGSKDGYRLAGVAHDALYRDGCNRDEADWVFWCIARSGTMHVPRFRAFCGWLGLRLGGWVAYRRLRRR